MKEKLTFEKFRLNARELNKVIKKETEKHDEYKKHFEWLLLKRKNELLKNGIENQNDRLGVFK
jgi:hypothetical protein